MAALTGLPRSQLAIREGDSSRVFWRSTAAPVRWTTTPLRDVLRWRDAAPGVATASVQVAGSGEAWRTRLVVVRLDPSLLRFSLDTAQTRARRPAWNVKHAPSDAVFAINAGQFRGNTPWGLVMLDGRLTFPAERGPLAVTMAFDSLPNTSSAGADSAPRWVFDGESAGTHLQWAFQSYPVLLRDHGVPYALQDDARGLDVGHRDARLAMGRTSDGELLVAITRFDGLGAALGAVPFGLTVPEMAAVMGALGAQHAVLLDGGISAQLLAGRGRARTLLSGWRDVPLGLIARPRIAVGR
jgi:exopolysaccharide biosynthesis protein